MSKNRKTRPRGGDSTEESLRGKNRELNKTIKQLQQTISQLEKQLELRPPSKRVRTLEKQKPSVNMCESCGKGVLKVVTVPKPGGDLTFLVCDTCQNQKKIK